MKFKFLLCFSLVFAVLTGMLLVSCSSNGNAQKEATDPWKTSATTMATTAPETTVPETTAPTETEPAPLQPIITGVDADSIQYYNCSESGNFAVIKKDGKCGIIDYTGKIIVPLEYTNLKQGSGHTYEYLMGTEASGNTICIDPAGKVQYAEYLGGDVDAIVYWYQDSYVWFTYEGGIDHKDSRRWMPEIEQRTWEAGTVLPVQELESVQKDGWVSFPVVKKASYGLLDMERNKMVSDFVYEYFDMHNGFQMDVLAVRKDGKWGFVDAQGNELTEFVYESYYMDSYSERIYSAVNGYIAVRQGGAWGLLDTAGNVVVDICYPGISQVNPQGYFWVRTDNGWSLYQLEGTEPVTLAQPSAAEQENNEKSDETEPSENKTNGVPCSVVLDNIGISETAAYKCNHRYDADTGIDFVTVTVTEQYHYGTANTIHRYSYIYDESVNAWVITDKKNGPFFEEYIFNEDSYRNSPSISGRFSQEHSGSFFLTVKNIDLEAQTILLDYMITFDDHSSTVSGTKEFSLYTDSTGQIRFFKIPYTRSRVVQFDLDLVLDMDVGIRAYS